MDYYNEPFQLVNKAEESVQYQRYQQALILYTEALGMAIELYKNDIDVNRKMHVYLEIQKVFESAETMKSICKLPKVPTHGGKLSPIEEIEEGMESIKISSKKT
jgi:hypothetical protein